ncbi:MAG: hypothetical protein ACXVNP_09835 [Bacteroidia bacterium]
MTEKGEIGHLSTKMFNFNFFGLHQYFWLEGLQLPDSDHLHFMTEGFQVSNFMILTPPASPGQALRIRIRYSVLDGIKLTLYFNLFHYHSLSAPFVRNA